MQKYLKYLPLLIIYFIAGFDGFTSVTFTFLKQSFYNLSAEQWAGLAIWAGLPWSIKIIYATFIDSISIFGSQRKSYMILGAILMGVGNVIMLDSIEWQMLPISQYMRLCLDFFVVSSGIVVCDIVADTLAVDLATPGPGYKQELGNIGIAGRVSLMTGAMLSSFITGWLAKTFTATQIITLWFICPIIIIIAALSLPIIEPKVKGILDKNLLYSGLIFLTGVVTSTFWLGAEESVFPIFGLTMAYILYLSKDFIKEIPKPVRKSFLFACVGIFCFRVIPSPGEATQWFMIHDLHLDQIFFGKLRIITSISGALALLIARKWIVKSDIARTLTIFTLIDVVLNLPMIGVYYGFTFGLEPGTILLLESAAASPLGNLAMIPLHILLAQYAPVKQRAVYIATTAAFVNSALMAGDLINKKLNSIYVVTQTNFSNLGNLLITSLIVSLIFSIIGICFVQTNKIN